MSGTNVVPFPGGGAPQMGPPPGYMVNPAFAAWQQQAQQVQAVIAKNQQLQAQFDAAVALIKKDGLHGFRLDIEADSTIAPDEQAEKQARIEFMQQFVPLMGQIVPLAQGNPALASLAREITLFAVRGFPVSRPIEETIEKAFDAIAQMPPSPQTTGKQGAPSKDPAVEQAKVQASVQDSALKARTDMAAVAQKQQQAILNANAAQEKTQAETERTQAELMLEVAKLQQSERLENARMTHMAARDASKLT